MNCPLCKQDPELSYDSEFNLTLSNKNWSIIDKTDINTDEYLQELDDQLVKSIKDLIS